MCVHVYAHCKACRENCICWYISPCLYSSIFWYSGMRTPAASLPVSPSLSLPAPSPSSPSPLPRPLSRSLSVPRPVAPASPVLSADSLRDPSSLSPLRHLTLAPPRSPSLLRPLLSFSFPHPLTAHSAQLPARCCARPKLVMMVKSWL